MPGLQEPELLDDQESQDDDGAFGVLEVLSEVPEAYAAQGIEVKPPAWRRRRAGQFTGV
jgi:hypothetical protein